MVKCCWRKPPLLLYCVSQHQWESPSCFCLYFCGEFDVYASVWALLNVFWRIMQAWNTTTDFLGWICQCPRLTALAWLSEWEVSAFCEKQWERRKLPGEEGRGWKKMGFSKVFPIFSFSILTIWQSRKSILQVANLSFLLTCCIQSTKSAWVIYLFGPKTRFCHVTYILTCISFVGPFQI